MAKRGESLRQRVSVWRPGLDQVRAKLGWMASTRRDSTRRDSDQARNTALPPFHEATRPLLALGRVSM